MQRLIIHLLFLLILAGRSPAQSGGQPVDGFAAEVDGKIVTVGDVIERVRPALLQLRRSAPGPDFASKQAEIFEEGLEKLIEQRLMIAYFESIEAQLPPTTLRERRDMILRERFGNSEEELRKVLRAVGKTEAEWEEELREQIIVQSMVQQFVRAKIHVSPREIREAYEAKKSELLNDVELKLRSIAFRPAVSGQEQERLRKIQEVMARLAEGADFAETAIEFSEGPKASQGGDEGWVNLSRLPADLREALAEAEPGTVTPLIDTPVQSYIFKIEDRRGGEIKSIAEAQSELKRELEVAKYDEIYSNWMEGLYKQFQVRRFHPDISAVTGDL